MLPLAYSVPPRTTSGYLKPSGSMNWWTKLCKTSVHSSKSTASWRKGGRMADTKEAKTAYNDTKHVAKHAVWLSKSEAGKDEFTAVSPGGDGVFHIAKQMELANQDMLGWNCVHNYAGELALTDEDMMTVWVEHHINKTAQCHLYADDLVLIVNTQKECISKLKAWKVICQHEEDQVPGLRCWSWCPQALGAATTSSYNICRIKTFCHELK